METLHSLCLEAAEVNIMNDAVLEGQEYTYELLEVIISKSFAMNIYTQAQNALKTHRERQNADLNELNILVDLGVVVLGEWENGWHYKTENLGNLEPLREIQISKLAVALHRKASVAWEFRKKLIPYMDISGERDFLDLLGDRQKQNYYLWMYRQVLFKASPNENEVENMMEFCKTHPSDSSAWHYLYFIVNYLKRKSELHEWVVGLCDLYYGALGLYTDEKPPGYECIHLFLAKLRFPINAEYIKEQEGLGRDVNKYLYIKS